MTWASNFEYVERAGTVVLRIKGFVCLQCAAFASMFFAASLTSYLFVPAPHPAQGAHDRLSAVVIPGVLGFALASLFSRSGLFGGEMTASPTSARWP